MWDRGPILCEKIFPTKPQLMKWSPDSSNPAMKKKDLAGLVLFPVIDYSWLAVTTNFIYLSVSNCFFTLMTSHDFYLPHIRPVGMIFILYCTLPKLYAWLFFEKDFWKKDWDFLISLEKSWGIKNKTNNKGNASISEGTCDEWGNLLYQLRQLG